MRNFLKTLAVFAVIFLFSNLGAKAKLPDFASTIPDADKKEIAFRNGEVFAPASFSLYAIGLYVNGTQTDNIKLKESDEPMALQLVSLSNLLTMKKLISELRRGFSYGSDHDKAFLATIQTEIDNFLDLLKNSGKKPRKNERITFLYTPKRGVDVLFNSTRLGTIPGYSFKKALFGIWLNNNCADEKLRDKIISLPGQKRQKEK